MKHPSRFWDRIAERYARKPVSDQATYEKKLEITRGYLRPDMEVLEFGCGTGSTALILAPHVTHIRAMDFSAKMIEIARGKAETQGIGNVTFEQTSIDDVALPDAGYDAVLAHSILHLLEDKEAVIAQVHRALKPGGVFVTTTACIGDMMVLFRLVAPVGGFLGLFPPFRVFTREELTDCLCAAGFRIDHQWQPGRNKGVFIVAGKPASP